MENTAQIRRGELQDLPFFQPQTVAGEVRERTAAEHFQRADAQREFLSGIMPQGQVGEKTALTGIRKRSQQRTGPLSRGFLLKKGILYFFPAFHLVFPQGKRERAEDFIQRIEKAVAFKTVGDRLFLHFRKSFFQQRHEGRRISLPLLTDAAVRDEQFLFRQGKALISQHILGFVIKGLILHPSVGTGFQTRTVVDIEKASVADGRGKYPLIGSAEKDDLFAAGAALPQDRNFHRIQFRRDGSHRDGGGADLQQFHIFI